MIILYTGFGISMSVFMMTGYIKSIPKDIEESAVIDGANIMQYGVCAAVSWKA